MYPIAIYAGIFAIGARRTDERLPFTAMTVAIAGAIVMAFIALRFSYYGELLPNSVFAKNNPSLSAFKEGARYVALFGAMALGPYVLLALFKRSPLLITRRSGKTLRAHRQWISSVTELRLCRRCDPAKQASGGSGRQV